MNAKLSRRKQRACEKAITDTLLRCICAQVPVLPPCALPVGLPQHQHNFGSKPPPGHNRWVGASRRISARSSGWPQAVTHSSCPLFSEAVGRPACLAAVAARLLHPCSAEHRPTRRQADRGHLVSHLTSKQTISPALSGIAQPEPGRQQGRKGALVLVPLCSSWRGACPLKQNGAATAEHAGRPMPMTFSRSQLHLQELIRVLCALEPEFFYTTAGS